MNSTELTVPDSTSIYAVKQVPDRKSFITGSCFDMFAISWWDYALKQAKDITERLHVWKAE
jgi:hypothetical protein